MPAPGALKQSCGDPIDRLVVRAREALSKKVLTMPIYEYHCDSCGKNFDAIQKFSDEPLSVCRECGAEGIRKLLSAPSFRLKGGGWYETDFKNKNQRNVVKKEGDGGSASAGADSGGSKSESGGKSDGASKSDGGSKDSGSKDSGSSKSSSAGSSGSGSGSGSGGKGGNGGGSGSASAA